MDRSKEWLESISTGKTDKEKNLLNRAVKTLEKNIFVGEDLPWLPYRCISPGLGNFDGIWNWDAAFHGMSVSRWNVELAKENILGFMKFQKESGLLPDVIWRNGIVVDKYSKPPVFPWAIKIIYENSGDVDFIKEIYPNLVKNEEYWRNNRMYGGMFFYDSEGKDDEDYITQIKYESGWDNSARWDLPITDLWPIDLNCFMVDFYSSMEFFARVLGKKEDEKFWSKSSKELSELINENLWDEKQECYVDTNRFTMEKSSVITPASFMPLFVEIAPKERAEAMNEIAINKFKSRMPTVSYDNPSYSTDYWRGPTWLNVAYFAAKGLKKYGFSTGEDIKNTILDWCYEEKRGIFENYDSISGVGLFCDHFSWSSAFIIEFICNF